MTAKCLSAFECSYFRVTGKACSVCQRAESVYVEQERARALDAAKLLLKHEGYIVTKKESDTP